MPAPIGNTNATKSRPWSDALRKAALRLSSQLGSDGTLMRKLDAAATRCVDLAVDGDMGAISELANRLDGKAVQPIAGEDGPMKMVVEIVNVGADSNPGQ